MGTLKKVAVLLLGVAMYGGTYMALLQPIESSVSGFVNWHSERIAAYRWGGDAMATAMAPAHWLDRHIRADYWEASKQIKLSDLNIPFGNR